MKKRVSQIGNPTMSSALRLLAAVMLLASASAFSPSTSMIGRALRGSPVFSTAPKAGLVASLPLGPSTRRPFPLRMAATLDAGAAAAVSSDEPKYVSKAEAKAMQEELLSEEGGFTMDQLVELSGQSIADSIFELNPPSTMGGKKIVMLCGKGTNGAYGLAAARHLHHMGYIVVVVYPDRERGDGGMVVQPQKGLEQQLRNLEVKVYASLPGFVDQCALLVDCVWGLGFEGVPGAPWDVMFKQLNDPAQFGSVPLVSVDLPSGWDADLGPPEQPVQGPDDEVAPAPITVMYPDVLISIGAPKAGVIGNHVGPHYLGFRPIPFNTKLKYGLNTPSYTGTRSYARLGDMTEAQIAKLEAGIAKEEALSTPAAAPAPAAPVPASATPPDAAAATAAAAAASAPGVAFATDIPQDVAVDVPVPPAGDWVKGGPPAPGPGTPNIAPPVGAAAEAAAVSYTPPTYEYGADDTILQAQKARSERMMMPPMPDDATEEALESITEDLLDFINEKSTAFWHLEVRNVISSRAVPIGEETNWPPYRTTVAKQSFVAAKAIIESGRSAMDILPEARKFATQAFEEDGDRAAGRILRQIGELYVYVDDDFEGELDEECVTAKKEIDELIARVAKERGLPEDLADIEYDEFDEEEEDDLPPKPAYKITDKWSISLISPKSVGDDEPVDIVVRPVQKARMLAKAWLQAMEMDEDQIDEIGIEVKPEPVTWKCGVVDLDEPIGESGAEDAGDMFIFFKSEREAELKAQAEAQSDEEESEDA